MATINVVTSDDPALGRGVLNAGAGESIDVRDHGAVGDGVADDTAEIQAAIDAAEAAFVAGTGATEVYFPQGVWLVSAVLTVGAGVTLRGAGLGVSTIKGTNIYGVVNLEGASDITVTGLHIQAAPASGTTSIGVHGVYNGLALRITISDCRITGTPNNAIRFTYAVRELTIAGNLFEDCDTGFTLYGPTQASGYITSQVKIINNRFRDVGSVNIACYGSTSGAGNISTINNVEISGNDLREFKQVGPAGPIPIEPTVCTNITIANNVIDGPATRGISTGNNVNMAIVGNVIRNQSTYAIELNGGRNISITGNVAEDCTSFARETGDIDANPTSVRLENVVIADNVYSGSGLASTTASEPLAFVNAKTVIVSGNLFVNWEYLRATIRVGDGRVTDPEDVTISGNTFINSDPNSNIAVVNVRSGKRTRIVNNNIQVHRDLIVADDYQASLVASMLSTVVDTVIDGNHVTYTGDLSAGMAVAIGTSLASADVCPGLRVTNNTVVGGEMGVRVTTTSADCVVYGNDTNACTTTDTVPATALTPSKSFTLDFPSIAAQSVTYLDVAMPGSNYSDTIALGTPHAANVSGAVFSAYVQAPGNVRVRAHNYSAAAANPASGSFKVTMVDWLSK